jgi:hypothetical protein
MEWGATRRELILAPSSKLDCDQVRAKLRYKISRGCEVGLDYVNRC